MTDQRLEDMISWLTNRLKKKQTPEGMWRGRLSSSSISTSVSLFALWIKDREEYAPYIERGKTWLMQTMKEEGTWGDTIESPANMTATLLTYASLYAIGTPPEKTKEYLVKQFGGSTDRHIIQGVLAYYGSDLTFSAPILVMCALAGVIQSWDEIPQLPFEVSVLPQKLFRFFRLPVVSYAIPALIAVGILRHKKGKKNILSPIRQSFISKSLQTLIRLQPENGGFLEAAPLTAFVTMCMCGADYNNHIATQKAVGFLIGNVREDGSWPIDTDLASWVTSLSIRALGDDLPDKKSLATLIRQNAFAFEHPFTGAMKGGWGWTNLPGAAPDADDTSGALIALHVLQQGIFCPEVQGGIEWLLALQNRDGGMPTFCKGWGKLPFDRSSPDISAHALQAFQVWMDVLPKKLQHKCQRSSQRLLTWMEKNQAADGSWTPLWFGDQNAQDERSPVYGTATAVEYLATSDQETAQRMTKKGINYLISVQNKDGGWGGAAEVCSKVTLTARALGALASYPEDNTAAMTYAFDYLYSKYQQNKLLQAEPIGLYFARLWYSEELYNITFALNALKKYKNKIS